VPRGGREGFGKVSVRVREGFDVPRGGRETPVGFQFTHVSPYINYNLPISLNSWYS